MFRLIPPFWFLFCALVMAGLHFSAPLAVLIEGHLRFLGLLPFFAGVVFVAVVRRQFAREKTEIHTFKPPLKLVTGGLFRISRNPLYLGFCLMLAGVWWGFGTLSPGIGGALFLTVAQLFYIPFEEKNLEREFGAEYFEYKKRVRRWI